jgi:RNA polymerase sigma-70 factor, ECF subfamily
LPTDLTDAELVALVRSGDLVAYTSLVDRHYPSCARYARRMTGNADDADDVLQDTFLLAFRALSRYREEHRFRAWLFRILINQCRSHARWRARQARRFAPDANPDAIVKDRVESDPVLQDALQTAIDSLEPLLREALLLKYGEQLEYDEMARMTGSSVSALKMRVKRGRDAVRPRIEELLND